MRNTTHIQTYLIINIIKHLIFLLITIKTLKEKLHNKQIKKIHNNSSKMINKNY